CCWRPFLLFRFLLGAQKKMKTGLRTSKSRLNCSFRGLHYPRHLKNNAEFAKIKRSPVKFNFQGHPKQAILVVGVPWDILTQNSYA
ncbi:MAG: hypothetical protein MJA30_30400, partial [Cytophagales bacterium]|nr:hypothetical protein [Cytophagales bacterium]